VDKEQPNKSPWTASHHKSRWTSSYLKACFDEVFDDDGLDARSKAAVQLFRKLLKLLIGRLEGFATPELDSFATFLEKLVLEDGIRVREGQQGLSSQDYLDFAAFLRGDPSSADTLIDDYYCLGNHPKPANDYQLKTGQR